MNLLEQIVASRRRYVAAVHDGEEMRRRAEQMRRLPHRFRAALEKPAPNIIGEFKRASPSLGAIRADANLAHTVRAYETGGVSALSILTEPEFFRGSLDDLREARAVTDLPILRKDFIVAEYQIDEAAVAGADAILLIVAALSDQELHRLRIRAEEELGLDAMVEVHSEREMERARDCGAKLIGVNNRDLRTFQTSLVTSETLAPLAPAGATLVSESGISTTADVIRLTRSGYCGFLIGESLMRANDPAELIRSLKGNPQIKVCGVTNAADARLCGELGVEMIGLNFSPLSQRCISLEEAREIIDHVRPEFPGVRLVGVFVDQEVAFVKDVARQLRLNAVQLHGEESVEYVSALGGGQEVIKALRVDGKFLPETVRKYECDTILLDTWSARARGGTGEKFDWSVAMELKPQVKRLILAGGLTPQNVKDAVEMVRPFAVDVCSGVETAAGQKDHEKLRRFVSAIR